MRKGLGAGGVFHVCVGGSSLLGGSQVECMPGLTHGRSDVVHLGPGTATVQIIPGDVFDRRPMKQPALKRVSSSKTGQRH